MKTKIILSLMLAVGFYSMILSETVTVTNSGNIFTPDEITVNQGDTVIFSLGTMHNAVEVSQTTWNANGNTSNGGFSVGYSGGEVIMNTPGTFYYVCIPHATLGMKGIITVTGTVTSLDQGSNVESNSENILNVWPNPVSDIMTLTFNVRKQSRVSIDLIDITGSTVQNIVKGLYETGTYSEFVNLGYLNSGKYFVFYKSDYKKAVLPLLLINIGN